MLAFFKNIFDATPLDIYLITTQMQNVLKILSKSYRQLIFALFCIPLIYISSM